MPESFEIFLATNPGLEHVLAQEAREAGFDVTGQDPGGVQIIGGWPDVWRANLVLRGANRILARIAQFRALHLAQLDKRARKIPWSDVLRPELPVRVEATCRASRIYHNKAAAQRVSRAIAEQSGLTISQDADLRIMVRIEDDLCTISLDKSGDLLHRRGHKVAVGKAPIRETLAALFLRDCGYRGTEPVLDPMCGSGTFTLEAAEIAAGLAPGRARAFAFQNLASFDATAWTEMRLTTAQRDPGFRFYGSDRDQGAVRQAEQNAMRAGVESFTQFERIPISERHAPDGPAGLVIVNPPYGARIGNKKLLYALYAAFGDVMKTRFSGWRVGLVTSEPGLARATQLPFKPPGPPISNGGLKVRLFQTDALP